MKPSAAGKGDDLRPVNKPVFDSNFDDIFRKKKQESKQELKIFEPKDLNECLDLITENMPAEDILKFAACPKDKLIMYHFNLGQFIRNKFGLWIKDNTFYKHMIETYKIQNHPDEVSMFIIEAPWGRLQLQLVELEKEMGEEIIDDKVIK